MRLHDYGCTLKAYRKDVVKNIRLYGEMHRFIPAMASWVGASITEVETRHHPRLYGTSNYGISRTIRVLLDLVTVKFLKSFSTRPIHAFGTPGLIMTFFGFVISVYLAYAKIILGQSIGAVRSFFLGVLLVIIGIQFIAMGLLAEMLARVYHESQDKPIFIVKKVLGRGSPLFQKGGQGGIEGFGEMTKERLMPVVKVAVSAALLYALFRKTDFNAFLNAVSSVSVFYAALAVLIYFMVQCVSAYRWSLILAKDVSVPYREILSIYFIGMFFNNFLPTIIGGDVVKGYYLYKRVGNGPKVFASIFMDRYSGFAALMAITLVAFVFGYFAVYAIGGAGLIGVFVLLMGGFVCVSLFLWFKGLHDWLVKALLKISFLGSTKSWTRFIALS